MASHSSSTSLLVALLIASCAATSPVQPSAAPSAAPSLPSSLPTGTVSMVGINTSESQPSAIAPSSAPSELETGEPKRLKIFYANSNAELLDPPAERTIDAPYIENALRTLLAGPTIEEMERGAIQRFDASVRLERVELSGNIAQCMPDIPCPLRRIARLYFTGNLCSVPGSAFNEASLVFETMEQFREVFATKIYLDGETQEPVGTVDSIPTCLEP